MNEQSKQTDLDPFREDPDAQHLTTNHGVRVSHTDDSLKAGPRGPTLMEDFHFREKLMHFDHERIPERVVHARGSGAHGYFQVYESMAQYTKAKFLQDPSMKTPVFVRFSTVVGSRGSADTVRDVRGFATKFYTEDGNYDLVGNNMPVFFIQDGIKFPDLVHAIKPEPHDEMPQASAAHDNFWDFISLMPESMHMIMWVLSDRALPRSYAMMEGFGVHTFRFVNAQGKARFVKFHWKPALGVHSLVWDETQKIAGKDPDFNRRDLWERIEKGDYPEYEFGVQMIEEEDEFKFPFDVLDPTKLWPEEVVPIRRVGKMVLNRNPDNFFAETEQAAFHPGHVVPGIDFTNDPLLQARLFSYLDTQLIRLGGPNFNEIPINRPVVTVTNNQQDGYMRQRIMRRTVNYFPNSLGDGKPMPAAQEDGGYVHYAEKVDGRKVRERGEAFNDHFSQATLFWNSQSDAEKQHLIDAFHFELSKVTSKEVRQRMIGLIEQVDGELATEVAQRIGVAGPGSASPTPMPERERTPAGDGHHTKKTVTVERSEALSMADTVKDTIKTRKVAALVAEGYNHAELSAVKRALEKDGAQLELVSQFLGPLPAADGQTMEVDKAFVTIQSVLYDAVYVPGGPGSIEALKMQGDALGFLNEAFRHCKPIAASNEGVGLIEASAIKDVSIAGQDAGQPVSDQGVVTVRGASDMGQLCAEFARAIAQHRHWERVAKKQVPA